jgi:hypothetical protein
MNRRIFVTHAVAATGLTAIAAKAQVPTPTPTPTPAPPVERIVVSTSIESNHGHAFSLTDVTVIKLLREAHLKGPIIADIRGAGSHPHALTLTEEVLLQLLVLGTIDVTSSVVGGHAHRVTLKLDVKLTPAPVC